jgi:hypothetical protein
MMDNKLLLFLPQEFSLLRNRGIVLKLEYLHIINNRIYNSFMDRVGDIIMLLHNHRFHRHRQNVDLD